MRGFLASLIAITILCLMVFPEKTASFYRDVYNKIVIGWNQK